jgi:hypothetical protein
MVVDGSGFSRDRVECRRGCGGRLVAGSAWAQVNLTPRVLRIDVATCQEVLSLSGEQRDRVLIYRSGYLDAKQHATTWEERLTGERIDRALAACTSKPETPLLRAFADAWSR